MSNPDEDKRQNSTTKKLSALKKPFRLSLGRDSNL